MGEKGPRKGERMKEWEKINNVKDLGNSIYVNIAMLDQFSCQ